MPGSTAAENYLRSLAGELNAQPTLGGASLMSAIATEMNAAEQTVEEDGVIATYVLQTWAIALPSAEEDATIADDIVTAEIQ